MESDSPAWIFPDSKTEEGEQINTEKIKAENLQLRDAVKSRTIELENKNRELEIEARWKG